jgi:hypothetical protein
MKNSQQAGVWLGAISLVLSFAFVGCSGSSAGPTTRVTGTVTLKGGPIPPDAQASIAFVPIKESTGVTASGEIKDGKYDIPDAPVGPVRVEFSINRMSGKSAPIGDGREGTQVLAENLLPEGSREGLEEVVSKDKSEMNFDLK